MSTVTCDVCGGIFSHRYLASHKRLAHKKNRASAAAPVTQKEVIPKIASLYGSLSVNGRKRVIRLLAKMDQKDNEHREIQ